jgi:hypothetical protein
MKKPEKDITKKKDIILNTNEVMRDYEFYLKMFIEDQTMDFDNANKKAS